MKYLSTRICRFLTDKQLSYDFAIWDDTLEYDKIPNYYKDQYNLNITNINQIEHFQPKNKESINFALKGFHPCILSVENDDYSYWLDILGFEPVQDIYSLADLVFLGYDIMDTLFISIRTHGISAEYNKDYYLLNQYGLFSAYNKTNKYLLMNKKEILEHNWKIIGIYTNKKTISILNGNI